ncbi:MAG: acetate--CoA ligase family protein [Geminicoccaceae bacterium]|nr:acetate--CoA ligase family protein [Geminicoccaceae bacterium]
MDRPSLDRLLHPRSIAVIGGAIAASVIRTLRRSGYGGQIRAVHPDHDEIEGIAAVPGITDLDISPDAAFVAVNRKASIDIMAELRVKRAGGAIAYASGYRETGTIGAVLERNLVEAAGRMPVIGPNAYGFINYLDGAALWLDHHGGKPCRRGVAIIGQSSNILINMTMQRRGLPIAFVIALGNQASVDAADLVEALLDDDRITAIGLHLEGISRATALAGAVEHARSENRPVVVLKSGRSEAGARQVVSHTATITGSDDVLDAWLRRIGAARVDSIGAFLETLKLLHVHGALPGRSLVSLSCSGGEAALVADAASSRDIDLSPFDDDDVERIAATTNPLVTIGNPFDYHTFDWLRPERLERTFEATMRGGHALAALVLDMPRTDRCPDQEWRAVLDAWIRAGDAAGKRIAVVSSLPEAMPEMLAESLVERGIVPLCGIEDSLDAVAAAAFIGSHAGSPVINRDDGNECDGPPSPADEGRPVRSFDEAEAKRLIAAYGIAIPVGRPVASPQDAIDAAADIGGAVVLKALSAEIAHKSARGGVHLDLRDPGSIDLATRALLEISARVLVERMIRGTVGELLVGIRHDPALGLYLVIGSGGTLVEWFNDRQVLIIPETEESIRKAIGRLRVARRLAGDGPGRAGDIDAAVEAILALQRFALAHERQLVELEINPLIVTASKAVAADAILRMYPAEKS